MKQIIPLIFLVLMGLGASGCLCDDDDCVIGTPDDSSSSQRGASSNGATSPDSPVADDLVSELCDAAVRCDARLTKSGCVSAMDGVDGRQIWDDFGLTPENSFDTAYVRRAIADGTVAVDETALNDCLHELAEACDNAGESFPVGGYANLENLIPSDGACPSVLSSGSGGGR